MFLLKGKQKYASLLFVIFVFLLLTMIDPFATLANDEYEAKTVQVKLERVYLDGEISEEILTETIYSLEDLFALYDGWVVVEEKEDMIHLRKEIDDISPLLKINGYFGISGDGLLNIYEGRPIEDKVIQSFFRINTKKLKSHQQIELQEGIPVMSRENYEDILNLYKQYAITEL